MLIALVVLNFLYLVCSLIFNAELLNMAGADIRLKDLETLGDYSQALAAVSMCLLIWRLCMHRFKDDRKKLWTSLALSTAIVMPATYWVQAAVPDLIAEQVPASYRVSSLYGYITKKGLLYGAIQMHDLPYEAYKADGEGKAFIANLGVLMSLQGDFVQKIDKNFQGFSAAVFKRYAEKMQTIYTQNYRQTLLPRSI